MRHSEIRSQEGLHLAVTATAASWSLRSSLCPEQTAPPRCDFAPLASAKAGPSSSVISLAEQPSLASWRTRLSRSASGPSGYDANRVRELLRRGILKKVSLHTPSRARRRGASCRTGSRQLPRLRREPRPEGPVRGRWANAFEQDRSCGRAFDIRRINCEPFTPPVTTVRRGHDNCHG